MNFNSYSAIKQTSNFRILLILLLIVSWSTVYGQNQLVTVSGKNVTLLKAFE